MELQLLLTPRDCLNGPFDTCFTSAFVLQASTASIKSSANQYGKFAVIFVNVFVLPILIPE
jgi:hypothetical protein